MKKIMLLMMCIVLISFTTALNFDNVKDYNSIDKEYTITNAFGFGEEVAKIKLDTPQIVNVGLGYQKVAEFTIDNSYTDYENVIKGIELYDIKNNMKGILRNVDYKYQTLVDVPLYISSCEQRLSLNGSIEYYNCKKTQKGITKETQWIDFDGDLTKDQKITVGIFTTVKKGDYVEWVINTYGEKLTEWAVWNASMNTNLMTYWDMDEGSGTTLNDRSGHGNTGELMNNLGWSSVNCIIGNCTGPYNESDHYINITEGSGYNFSFGKSDPFSISFWFNSSEWSSSDEWIISKAVTDVGWSIYLDTPTGGSPTIYFVLSNTFPTDVLLVYTNYTESLSKDQLYYFVFVNNGTADASQMLMFINGTVLTPDISFDTLTTNPNYAGAKFRIGLKNDNLNDFNGTLDEIAIWNRALSTEEVSDLYNGSYGLKYSGPPEITYNFPIDDYTTRDPTITFNCTGTDAIQVNNVSLIIDGILNETVTGTSPTLELYKSVELTFGSHTWYCNVTDDENNEIQGSERSLTIGFINNSETYNATTYEMATEGFILNISYNESVTSISANLIYNGTSYLGTGSGDSDSYILTRTINIPTHNQTTSQTNSFYWNVIMNTPSGSVESNTSANIQTVDSTIFSLCNATYPPPVFVNYTTYDEDTRDAINATMDATFTYWLGDGDITRSYTLADYTNQNFKFCATANKTFNINAVIKLNASGYNEKTYTLKNTAYSNATTEEELFMLSKDNGTNVIVEVTNAGLTPLSGYSVIIERYYPELGDYEKVFEDVTDDYGQVVPRLIENTVKYKFTFKNPSGTTVKTTGDLTIACRATICVLPFVIEDTTEDFERFENVTDLDWSLTYSNSTDLFTFSWNDNTGETVTYRLYVQRVLFNGTTMICNTTTTSTSSSLTCDTTGIEATYIARAYRRVTGESERFIVLLNIKVGERFGTFGKEGLFWTFILLFTMLGIGAFNPPLGVILYNVGFIFMGLIGIISFNLPIFFATNIIMVLFIWAYKS